MIHTIDTIRAKEPESARDFLARFTDGGFAIKRRLVYGINLRTGKEGLMYDKYEKVKA